MPIAVAVPNRHGRSIERQPITNRSRRIGPTWPSLIAYTSGHDIPPSNSTTQRIRTGTGISATAAMNVTRRIPVNAIAADAGARSVSGNARSTNGGG